MDAEELTDELKALNELEREKEEIKNNFTYHSNKIEGLTLTYGETIKFLRDSLIIRGAKPKDLYDLKNHKAVLDKIFSAFNEIEISEKTIKSLHAELMHDDAQWPVQDAYIAGPGHYKTEDNYTIRPGGATHAYLSHELVNEAMRNLVEDTVSKLRNTDITSFKAHPVAIISRFHFEFLQIHPFSDGNGRMARLLSTLLFLKKKYPPIIIEEQERMRYFSVLIDSETVASHMPIVAFFTEKISALLIKSAVNKA